MYEISEIPLEQQPIRRVDSFASSYTPNSDPHLYPGERPPYSYLTDGETVSKVSVRHDEEGVHFDLTTEEGTVDLDEHLISQGLPPMAERIPVVAYGANASPVSLAEKFAVEGRPDLRVVPTLKASMMGVDVVWHKKPGIGGSYYAELYRGPETAETSVGVGVNFLTPEQLLYVHKTEPGYDFGMLGNVGLEEDSTIPAIVYAGVSSVFVKDGHPVAVRGIERSGSELEVLDSRGMMEYTLSIPEVQAAVATDAPELVQEGLDAHSYVEEMRRRQPLKTRVKLQRLIEKALTSTGHTSEVLLSEGLNPLSWSNPSTIPTFHELLSGAYMIPKETVTGIELPVQTLERVDDEQAMAKRQATLAAVRKHWWKMNRPDIDPKDISKIS